MSEEKGTVSEATDGYSPGDVLGERFKLLEPLGSGAMGSVWKAVSLATDTVVCLKVLKHAKPSKKTLQRFQQESRALARLGHHQHIVRVHAFEPTNDGRPFLVTEFVDGKSLQQIINELGTVPEARALGIFKQIAETLQYAHTEGILHRDIKPENVMLNSRDGSDFVKLVDFGLAHLEPRSGDSQKLTQSGVLLGSPSYSSPELHEGKRASVSSDVYALGCLMYETITGRCAFTGDTAYDTYQNHLHIDVDELVENIVNRRLAYVIKRCLAKKPAGRFESMADVLSEWPSVEKGEEKAARAGERSRRRRAAPFKIRKTSRLLVVAMGMVFTAVVLVAIIPLLKLLPARDRSVSHEYWYQAHELRNDYRNYLKPKCQKLYKKALKANEQDHLLSDRQLNEAELAVALTGLQVNHNEWVKSTTLAESYVRRCLKTKPCDQSVLEAINDIEIGYRRQGHPERSIPILEEVLAGCRSNIDNVTCAANLLVVLYVQAKHADRATALINELEQHRVPPDKIKVLEALKSQAELCVAAGKSFPTERLIAPAYDSVTQGKKKAAEVRMGAAQSTQSEEEKSDSEDDDGDSF